MSAYPNAILYNQDFNDEDQATLLQYLASPPDRRPHLCGWFDGQVVCNQPLLPDEFASHLRRHGVTGDDKTKIRCCWVRCGTVMNKESVNRHVLETHLELKYMCPVCGYQFSRKDTMVNHQRNAHPT